MQRQIVSLRSQESLCQARPFDHWWYGWCKVHGQQRQKRGYHLQFFEVFWQDFLPNTTFTKQSHMGHTAHRVGCVSSMLHWQALMVSDAKIIALYIKVDAGTKSHEIPFWPSGCPLQNSSSFLWNWEFRVGELRGLLNVLKHAQKGDIPNPQGWKPRNLRVKRAQRRPK